MINGVCNTNGDALLYLRKFSCIKVGEETIRARAIGMSQVERGE